MTLGQYTTVFTRSIVLAVIATVICLVLAFPISFMLSRLKASRQSMMLMLIMLPMWMNFLLRTYAWMSLLEDVYKRQGETLYVIGEDEI